MFSKKQLVLISFILAILFHLAFYSYSYGLSFGFLQGNPIYFLALGSTIIMIFLYFGTYWRPGLKGNSSTLIFDLLILWIFICFLRSLLEMGRLSDLIPFLLGNYLGISLFPVLFFIVGININYFYSINRILSVYLVIAAMISLLFINYFELQIFLLMPIFYLLLTIPLRASWSRILLILLSIFVIVVSLSNRAGILRILMSYVIIMAYYVMLNVKINKKLLNVIVFCLLMIPVVSLYMGIKGQSVFQTLLGEDTEPYSQLNPYADTRTLLYYEVFQDLKFNDAFIFGKGLNAGYYSGVFETYSREVVEVGFLQILLKTGITGFILYISVIVSGIFKALGKSKNLFIKSLGLLLASYVLLLFIENVVAYNLLNVIVWIVVGMCHSERLRGLNNKEIKELFVNPRYLCAQVK